MNNRMAVCSMALALAGGAAFAQTQGAATSAAQSTANGASSAAATVGQAGQSTMGSMSGMNMPGQASVQDKTFLKTASDGSLFEIKTSELALQKSNSADIKQYAQQMIDDHNKMMEQMKPIAQEANVTPPTDLVSKMHKTEYKKLQGLSGNAFDQQYIKDQYADHRQTEQAFKTEESSGQLADEKATTNQGQPIIDDHMQKIQQIAQAHNVQVSSM